MFGLLKKDTLPDPQDAPPGNQEPMVINETHLVTGNPMRGPWPAPLEVAVFGMGCFWGVERLFWQQPGVYSTAVGYAGGYTENPSYEQVCSGLTGHNEVVQVVYDPARISYTELLRVFWESHDPTQGMRQGNDRGTQYRSGIYATTPEQLAAANTSKAGYQKSLNAVPTAATGQTITTEVLDAPMFFYAEDYHQQYLQKNPGGYCNLRGTGVACAS